MVLETKCDSNEKLFIQHKLKSKNRLEACNYKEIVDIKRESLSLGKHGKTNYNNNKTNNVNKKYICNNLSGKNNLILSDMFDIHGGVTQIGC